MRKSSKRSTKRASSGSNEESSQKKSKSENDDGHDSVDDSGDEGSLKNGGSSLTKSQTQNGKKSTDDLKKKKRPNAKDKSVDESNSISDEETVVNVSKGHKKTKSSTSSKSKDAKTQKKNEKQKPDDGQSKHKTEEEFEVEEIIAHKKKRGKMLYLVRWKGYDSDSDTWETYRRLGNCLDILKKYTDEHPDGVTNEKLRSKRMEYVYDEGDENREWEVEKILDVYFKKDKSREFLIRWKNYATEYDSWEPEENLNCTELISRYMQKVDEAKTISTKELRQNPKHTQHFTLRTQTSDRRLSKRHEGKQRVLYHDAEF